MSRREEEKQNKKQNKEDKFWFKPAHVASQSLTPNTYDDIHGKGTYTSGHLFTILLFSHRLIIGLNCG